MAPEPRGRTDALQGAGETAAVSLEGPEVGEEPVRDADRLGPAQMRVRGHEEIDRRPRLGEKGALETADLGVEPGPCTHRPEARVRRDLIVARPAGVQLPRDVPDLLVEEPLDQGMNVLVGGILGRALGDPLPDTEKSAVKGGGLRGGEDPGPKERLHPRTTRLDVLPPHATVDGETPVELVQRRGGASLEASAPESVRPARAAGGGRRRGLTSDLRADHAAPPFPTGESSGSMAETRAPFPFATGAASAPRRPSFASIRVGSEKRRMNPAASP